MHSLSISDKYQSYQKKNFARRCGICEAIHPTCIRVLVDYEDAENKVLFASASISKLGDILQASFPSDCSVHLDKNGCSPVFAMYRHKSCVAVLTGVDAPQFLTQIDMNIPGKSLGGE